MLLTCYPALAGEPPVLVDWLPRSHVFGSTCSFGTALFSGGTFYIDDGRPLPGQIEETVRNLREVAPILYSNVPKGYEELVPWLRRDRALRKTFFSRVRILQFAGASLAQHDGADGSYRAPCTISPNRSLCWCGGARQYCGGASTVPPSWAAACQPHRGS